MYINCKTSLLTPFHTFCIPTPASLLDTHGWLIRLLFFVPLLLLVGVTCIIDIFPAHGPALVTTLRRIPLALWPLHPHTTATMNVTKKFDRLKQWTNEKMGAEARTGLSDEFKALELEMNLRHEGMHTSEPCSGRTLAC
jgi:hypothetical protein